MNCSTNRPFRRIGTMLDCSRNAVMTVDSVKRWIDITADLGHNCLLLYLEDTYEVEDNPYFGHLRGRYSMDEMRAIDDYAFSRGMEVIPCIQTLAHMNCLFHWARYAPLNDCNDILLAGDEKVYELIDRMFASLKSCFRTNMLHIGMDEAHMLGRGRYMDINGVQDRFGILLDHLNRVADIATKYGYEMTMWSDMFFRLASGGDYYTGDITISSKFRDMIPKNVKLVYWDYYSTDGSHFDRQMEAHEKIKDDFWYAGGLWTWAGYAPHNRYSIDSMTPAINSCISHGVQDIFFTMWGDDGGECSKFALLPALYYVSEYIRDNTDLGSIKEGFEKRYGIPFDAFMLLDLPGTPNDTPGEVVNADKYMLYCDCFMGQFDCKVQRGDAASYAVCAEKLSQWTDHPEFGYLFASAKAFCDVLAVKYDIGVRTRNVYLTGDKSALGTVAEEYAHLEQLVQVFYDHYSALWLRDNKFFGMDVIDLRLGGLLQRIRHCRIRLEDYCGGKISRIEELDAPVLAAPFDFEDGSDKHALYYGGWKSMASACIV